MAPPLQYDPRIYTQAAKDVSHAAWTVSEVAWTLLDNAAAATSPSIKAALTGALTGCQQELTTVQSEAERVAIRVKTVAGVAFLLDNSYSVGVQPYDGRDYDTRHNRQPQLLFQPGSLYGQNPFLPPKLPGE